MEAMRPRARTAPQPGAANYASRLTAEPMVMMTAADHQRLLRRRTTLHQRPPRNELDDLECWSRFYKGLPSATVSIGVFASLILLAIGLILGHCASSHATSGEKEFVVRRYLEDFERAQRFKPVSSDFWLEVHCCCKGKLNEEDVQSAAASTCFLQEGACSKDETEVWEPEHQCHWEVQNYTKTIVPLMRGQGKNKAYQLLVMDSLLWHPLLESWGFPVLKRFKVLDRMPDSRADLEEIVKDVKKQVETPECTSSSKYCQAERSRPNNLFVLKRNRGSQKVMWSDPASVVRASTTPDDIWKFVEVAFDDQPAHEYESWAEQKVKPAVVFEELYDYTSSTLKLKIQVVWGRWIMAIASELNSQSKIVQYWAINSKGGVDMDSTRTMSRFTVTSCEVDRMGCRLKKSVEMLLPECIMQAEAIADILRIPWLRVDFFAMGSQGVRINRLSYETTEALPYLDRHVADFYALSFIRKDWLFKSPTSTLQSITNCNVGPGNTLECEKPGAPTRPEGASPTPPGETALKT